MNKSFKTYNGIPILDVVEYTQEYLAKNKNILIFIGTDSQKFGKSGVSYATTICFRDVGHGAHVIYKKTKRRDIKSFWDRLWAEVEYSVEVGQFLKSVNIVNPDGNLDIHLDLNGNEVHDSNKLYSAAVGYCQALGFNVVTKPYAVAASCAADALCR